MLTTKGAQFGFDLPSRFVTLATTFNPALAVLPVVGIANQHLYGRHCPEQTAPAPAMMTQLLDTIVLRVLRCLERDGLLIRDPEQPWLDLEARDVLDALGAASIQYRIAVGPHAGRKVLTLKLAPAAATSSVPKPFTVARDGFSSNAATCLGRDDSSRARLAKQSNMTLIVLRTTKRMQMPREEPARHLPTDFADLETIAFNPAR